MAGKYEAEGTGLASYVTRKNIYTAVVVVAAVVVAVLVTIGFVTMDDIKTFIELTVYLVGVLGGVAGLIAAAIARNNVEPPAGLPAGVGTVTNNTGRDERIDPAADYLN